MRGQGFGVRGQRKNRHALPLTSYPSPRTPCPIPFISQRSREPERINPVTGNSWVSIPFISQRSRELIRVELGEQLPACFNPFHLAKEQGTCQY